MDAARSAGLLPRNDNSFSIVMYFQPAIDPSNR
jgi:hypothetical protein